jgi:hypothetical protein
MDANPTTFAVVYFHVLSPDPYRTAWGEDRGDSFYDIWSDGIPWFAYDGLFDAWWLGSSQGSQNYEPNLELREAVPTDVTIGLTGRETGTQTYEITAHVCVEAGGSGKTMRVYMVDTLDHYPATPTYERNCFMQAATTQDLALAAGACVDVTRTFVFAATSWAHQSDIKIVAWAQTPNASYPAEVHQAKVMSWPFPVGAAIFDDGFESGSTSDWSIAIPLP